MTAFPKEVRIHLERDTRTGLFAALSNELPGLMAVATTIEEIEERLPAAVAQLVRAQYGAAVNVNIEPIDRGGFGLAALIASATNR